jgi:Cu-processing system permease protein
VSAQRIGTLIRLELTQRVRSVAWYVLLSVFFVLILAVTVLAFASFGYNPDSGAGVFSAVVFFVLLLAVLVSPTLSGNAINGDRDAATLAPVQVTLATTGEILIAKFLAAWITGLAFVAVSVPFLLWATLAGGVTPAMVVVSLVILIVEIGVVAAIGVGLSGILGKPLFSVAVTYLVVAALVVGTVITFGLVGSSVRTEVTSSYRSIIEVEEDGTAVCGEWQTSTYETPRFDTVWWVLAANPFLILADATPTTFDDNGYPRDLFGQFALAIRSAQVPPETDQRWDDCSPQQGQDYPTPQETIESTTPSWFVGLGLQLLLAAGLLWWAWARTRTPARRLPPGTRIA